MRNLRFAGLRFEHTDFPLPAFGYSEIQAAHFGPNMKEPTCVQPVALELSYANNIRFEHCGITHFTHTGTQFTNAINEC